MNKFILYEQVEENKVRILGEGVKFSNGKVAVSFLGQIPHISTFDNIDQCSLLHCNDKIKLFVLPEKKAEEEKKED